MTRFAIDGIDGAGKTTFAARLAELINAPVVAVDDFLRPEEERYRRGRDSAEGYYLDSFDNDRFREAVLAAGRPVVAEGVFLQRPELDDLWNVRIWLDVDWQVALERVVARDDAWMADARERYERRYFAGQRLYLDAVDPRGHADLVVAA